VQAAALISSIVNIASWLNLDLEMFIRISNVSNALSIFFHCQSWCISSVLRFLYIKHSNWIDENYPDQKKLRNHGIIGLVITYLLLVSPVLVYLLYLGTFNFFHPKATKNVPTRSYS